ncbi:unnamed protein product [Blepharisma stoltei]|uniref:MORN repeat protein n=1 Tax=Blepharisma stoltei TaxID=1481888 RepID=A0AAU9IQS7_9CILI|nr:unnamed protein product [Blepharisma stoltei]
MGADCSCLRDDNVNKEEMDMRSKAKPTVNRQEAANPEDDITNGNASAIIEVKKEPEESLAIHSAARGYLVRKEIAATKNTKGFDPTSRYTLFTDPLSSKIAKAVKKAEKEWGKFEPQAPEDDGEKITQHPAFELEDGSIYEGEWNEQGERHGLGTEISPDGAKYIGYFKNNEKSGNGRLIQADGEVYQGEFKKGRPNGVGTMQKTDGSRYEGSFKNGAYHGKGKEEYDDGVSYKGEYKNGQKDGKGIINWPNGSKYEGQFKAGDIEGYGVFVWAEGKKYTGNWVNNKMHGQGAFEWPDGRKYEGEYQNDLKHGHGVLSWPDGKTYDGEFKEGKQDGEGVLTFENKNTKKTEIRRGIWKKGNRVEWIKDKKKSKE